MDPSFPAFQALHVSLYPSRPTIEILAQFCTEWPAKQISEISRPDFPTIPTPRPDSVLFQHAGGASHGVAPDTVCKTSAVFCCWKPAKATNLCLNSMTCSPSKGRELSVDGQRENCKIIPLPCFSSSLSISYIALLRFVHVHIIPRPHSFAYFDLHINQIALQSFLLNYRLMYFDGQIAFILINSAGIRHIFAFYFVVPCCTFNSNESKWLSISLDRQECGRWEWEERRPVWGSWEGRSLAWEGNDQGKGPLSKVCLDIN